MLVSGGIAPPFLTSALNEVEASASRPGPLCLRGTHWIRGSVGPRAGLEAVKYINIHSRLKGMRD
jgi:hypothetical protein